MPPNELAACCDWVAVGDGLSPLSGICASKPESLVVLWTSLLLRGPFQSLVMEPDLDNPRGGELRK